MDEQNIPIDINTNKLLEWLISRRHVQKDWQSHILKVREKINNAIQDMPAHEGIIKLVSGQHINYFHCLKIVEILKETEADTKNLFGRYGSQRMKDWQDILTSYQKDNVYLAEAAQMLIRNVNYEIPSLKKQIAKLEQAQVEAEKKIKDYAKTEVNTQKEFAVACEQLGIAGRDIKNELVRLLDDLPKIYDQTAEKIKLVKPAIELYSEFHKYLKGKDEPVLQLLKFLVENGNTTTYEYTYGEKPIRIEEDKLSLTVGIENEGNADDNDAAIDFGAEGAPAEEIDFGDDDFGVVEDDDNNEDPSSIQIDWGNHQDDDTSPNNTTTDEDFEIVEHADLNVLGELEADEESGIVVERSGMDGGVATGSEALTLLDNPSTREQIINDLVELECFLKMRLSELSHDSDVLFVVQEAPAVIQMQTLETITSMSDCVNIALVDMTTNKRIQHLHNIKHSPKYIEILTASLKQKLSLCERLRQNVQSLEEQIKGYREEIRKINPSIKLLIEKSKQLQKEVQDDISKRYKGRIVNIVGGINML